MLESRFVGGLSSYIMYALLAMLITTITFGICAPWGIVLMYRWKIENTIIDGRRLRFDGTAMGLFGQWIKWFLLSIITLGIYAFWLNIKLEQWKVKHTHRY